MLHALSRARYPMRALSLALVLTAGALVVWGATGARGYTAFTSIEVVTTTPAADDPLAGTGFYEADEMQQVQETKGFQLGLPAGTLEVSSIPTWCPS